MSLLTDYHTHNALCHHATGHPAEYARSAERLGLAEFGASDHNPSPTLKDDWRMQVNMLDTYLDQVAEARHAVNIPVRLGMECDYLVGEERSLDWLESSADWDYLIGAVHYLDRQWAVDDPRLAENISVTGVTETWNRYWSCYIAMIQSKRFDFVAHPDLVKKFGHVPDGNLDRYYQPVIEALVAADGCFEINTAGWHKDCREQYPHQRFLELAGQAGLPIVISSDAHTPDEIGRDFDQALSLAKGAGIRYLARFEKRQRRLVEIE